MAFKAWQAGDLRVMGTTVLTCGCGIPWDKNHRVRDSVVLCSVHGVTTIHHIR